MTSLSDFLASVDPVIRLVLTDVRGSSPREAGAEMFVTSGAAFSTIGGGRLEYDAILAARQLLDSGGAARVLDIPLGPEIGQCCGGRVQVSLTRMSEHDRAAALHRAETEQTMRPHLYIMGSGHVGRALALQAQHLPFRTHLIDPREGELAQAEALVEKRLSVLPEREITAAPAHSAFVIATHDHALDFLLTAAALNRGDAAYIGLIGSATKRAKFEAWARENGGPATTALTCPIGTADSRDKRPAIIAAFVLAEVTARLAHSAAPSLDAYTALERRNA